MLFNFFKKQQAEQPEVQPEILARLSYIITSASDSPIVDVELQEYNDECVSALCQLIDTLGEEQSYVDTLEIVKNGMVQDQQESYLLKVFANMNPKSKLKIINHTKKKNNEPCIKPSDMLK